MDDLEHLKDAVDRAQAEECRAPREGERKYVLPLTEHLTDDDWHRLWRVVRALRREHPNVFIRFAEATLAGLLVDEIAEYMDTPALEDLASRLRGIAESEGPWLVSTPINNIITRDAAVQLAEEAVLWRATLGTEWMDEPFGGDDDNSEFEVHDFLGDRLPRVTRWLRFSEGERLDTGAGAQLLTVEEGTAALALARARSKAQYALAVWSILAPPEGWKVLPDLGIWAQQPRLQRGQRFKVREHEQWIPRQRTRGSALRHWGEFQAPESDLLSIPFRAMERIQTRSSQALLSAALAQHQASRGSRFLLSERVRSIRVAIECLCEPGSGGGHADQRWSAVAARCGVWEQLRDRGYEQADEEAIRERLRDARNIATHGADAALVDLGFPEDHERPLRGRRVAYGTDLAVASVQSDLSPIIFAVGFVLEKLFLRMQACDWDDELFEAHFSETP